MFSFSNNKTAGRISHTQLLRLFAILPMLVSSCLYAASDAPKNLSRNNVKNIVVTIKPIYSLVAHLTDGISTPILLSNNIQSPHHHNIRPSERRLIDHADMIIWLGPQMETYLSKIIKQQKNIINVSLMQAGNLNLLNKRSKHSHDDKETNSLSPNTIDQHIWLSITNAKAMSQYISSKLVFHDPKNTALYKRNLKNLLKKIEQTDDAIRKTLNDSKQPFIVAHDAFQYFEKEYNLNYIAALNSGNDTKISLKHLTEIISLIKEKNIQCLVYQQPKPALIDTLTQKTGMKAVALDPLGIRVNNKINAWFEIIQKLAINFHQCLN